MFPVERYRERYSVLPLEIFQLKIIEPSWTLGLPRMLGLAIYDWSQMAGMGMNGTALDLVLSPLGNYCNCILVTKYFGLRNSV